MRKLHPHTYGQKGGTYAGKKGMERGGGKTETKGCNTKSVRRIVQDLQKEKRGRK